MLHRVTVEQPDGVMLEENDSFGEAFLAGLRFHADAGDTRTARRALREVLFRT